MRMITMTLPSLATTLVFLCSILTGKHPFAAANIIKYNYIKCEQVPTLHCRNGSTCTPGIASFGSHHDHLGLQTQDSGYHCKCKAGFIGHQCEIMVDECLPTNEGGGDPLSCYHGSKCQPPGSSVACDCNTLNDSTGSMDTKFAGSSCQHESTSFCAGSLVGTLSPNHQFCTNHGTCVKMVMAGELHPGCECKDGWDGDHCEIRRDPFAVLASAKSNEGNGTMGKVLFSLLIIAIIVVALGIAYLVIKEKSNGSSDTRAPSAEVFKDEASGRTPAEKVTVGLGDLEADGSGTLGSPLGSPSKDGNGAANGGNSESGGELIEKDETDHSMGTVGSETEMTEIV